VNYLRDKKPDDGVYNAFNDPKLREQYDNYRIKAKDLQEVGFRCVLPL
jgi:hypothetical protein